jgi:hypothetical protein
MECGEVYVYDDGHIWWPKHVEAIKLRILSHLVGSLPFTVSTMHDHMNIKNILSFIRTDGQKLEYNIGKKKCGTLHRSHENSVGCTADP